MQKPDSPTMILSAGVLGAARVAVWWPLQGEVRVTCWWQSPGFCRLGGTAIVFVAPQTVDWSP